MGPGSGVWGLGCGGEQVLDSRWWPGPSGCGVYKVSGPLAAGVGLLGGPGGGGPGMESAAWLCGLRAPTTSVAEELTAQLCGIPCQDQPKVYQRR